MTKALVVHESIFGDARAIALAVAEGLTGSAQVEVVAAAQAPQDVGPEVGLLVVGGPNHAFGMPRPSTRQSAVEQHGARVPDADEDGPRRPDRGEAAEQDRARRSGRSLADLAAG